MSKLDRQNHRDVPHPHHNHLLREETLGDHPLIHPVPQNRALVTRLGDHRIHLYRVDETVVPTGPIEEAAVPRRGRPEHRNLVNPLTEEETRQIHGHPDLHLPTLEVLSARQGLSLPTPRGQITINQAHVATIVQLRRHAILLALLAHDLFYNDRDLRDDRPDTAALLTTHLYALQAHVTHLLELNAQ